MPAAYRILLFLAAMAFALVTAPAQESPKTDAVLAKCRHDFAMRFCEVETHAALAGRQRTLGRPLTAFAILEGARRRFGVLEVDAAYCKQVLGWGDASETRIAELKANLAATPGDKKLLRQLIEVYAWRGEEYEARPLQTELLALDPTDVESYRLLFHRRIRCDDLIRRYAGGFPNEPETVCHRAAGTTDLFLARDILAAGERAHPKSGLVQLHLALNAEKRKELDEAEKHFLRAAALAPEDEDVQGETGRFFWKVRKDEKRALRFLLNTYFQNPYHYTDWLPKQTYDYTQIALRIGKEAKREKTAAGATMIQLLRDEDPFVVGLALRDAAKRWKPEYAVPVAALLARDHSIVCGAAVQILMKKADASFEPHLEKLLASDDLRVSARALYVAVALRKEKAHPLVLEALKSDAELLRFEAIGALFFAGGPAGRHLVEAHKKREKSAILQKVIDSDLERWPGGP